MTMIDHLTTELRHSWLSPLDALRKCGCLSLSQRVGDLIHRGHNVQKKWVHLDNGKRVMSYRIFPKR